MKTTRIMCVQCGDWVTAKKSNIKWCSDKCRKQYARSHKPKVVDPYIGTTHIREDGMVEFADGDLGAWFAGTLKPEDVPNPYSVNIDKLSAELKL